MSEHDDLGDIRFRPENAALLMLAHQTGIMAGVADIEPNLFRSNVPALAEVGKLYGLPVLLSAPFANGPNGPLLADLTGLFPDVTPIYRPGEINAWDNPDVVRAVEATGEGAWPRSWASTCPSTGCSPLTRKPRRRTESPCRTRFRRYPTPTRRWSR